jgi:hypothetical protein
MVQPWQSDQADFLLKTYNNYNLIDIWIKLETKIYPEQFQSPESIISLL